MFKFFQSKPSPVGPATEVGSSSPQELEELAEEYRGLILQQLAHGGVSTSSVEIDVHQTGALRDGRHIFVGMLRLVRWERTSAVRLLLGLPILESRLRRQLKSSWLHEVSHFSGVWLHASGQLQDSMAMQDLRALVLDIEKSQSRAAAPDESMWSLPTDMGHLRQG
jgi:hypothetical protein